MNGTLKSAASTGAISRLTDLGFTRYEALAYLVLLEEHPATAYEISKRGALAKANVYTALVSLVQKGAVQPVSNEPVRYAPVDPHTLFRNIAKNTTALCEDLASTLTSREQQKALDYVWIVAGEQRLHDKIMEMISSARQQIWIKAPHHLLEPYVNALKKACKRGATLRVILFGTDQDAKRLGLDPKVQLYLHEGSGDMLAVGKTQFVVAADWKETLIADFGPVPQGAYTRSQAVVFMAETVIRHEVYLAEIINEFGPAIEKRFGKDLLSLRQKYLPPDLLKEVQKRANGKRPRRRAPSATLNQ
ncbi:MAG: TrmB family transcriptional regulator [Burkholderiales bacterium]